MVPKLSWKTKGEWVFGESSEGSGQQSATVGNSITIRSCQGENIHFDFGMSGDENVTVEKSEDTLTVQALRKMSRPAMTKDLTWLEEI